MESRQTLSFPFEKMDLTAALEATVSSDQNALQAAQKYLESASQQNLAQFLVALVTELADAKKSQIVRMAAGLQLKNQLTSKDATVRLEHEKRWLSLDEGVKTHVKNMLQAVQTLGTEIARPAIALQCIAAIASAEIYQRQGLIGMLCHCITDSREGEKVRENALETLGYICQDIRPEHPVEQRNTILEAIVTGMKKEEASIHIRIAATNALLNSLEFTKQNFERVAERNYIMQAVLEATQTSNIQLKVAALQNIVKIVSLYYQHMEEYMGTALFPISLDAIKSDCDEIALQGIEFWSSICHEEMVLEIKAVKARENNKEPEQTSKHYAKGILPYIAPLLTECLTKQEESVDDNNWNLKKAARQCLMLLAQCCGDNVLHYIPSFIETNIVSEDWKLRNAAVIAFGSILEGPDPQALQPYAAKELPTLLQLMGDQSVVVRDSVAWTLTQICEILPQVVIGGKILQLLVQSLLESLEAEPRVAANVCWALSSLGKAAYEAAPVPEEEEEPQTYALSPWFRKIVEKLLEVADRGDADNRNLRSSAHEAAMKLIKYGAKDCHEVVQGTKPEILDILNRLSEMELDNNRVDDLNYIRERCLQAYIGASPTPDQEGFHSVESYVFWSNIPGNNQQKSWKDFSQAAKNTCPREMEHRNVQKFLTKLFSIEHDTDNVRLDQFLELVALFGPFKPEGCLQKMYELMQDSISVRGDGVKESWFAGRMNETEADVRLRDQIPGHFLLRISSSKAHDGVFVLSVKTRDKGVVQIQIERDLQNSNLLLADREFKDLKPLVDVLRRHVLLKYCNQLLINPCPGLPLNAIFTGYVDAKPKQ